MDRRVLVISGVTLSGKSWLLERLLRMPEYQSATVVRMDDVRKQWWGDRDLTSVEGNFRNELTRITIKAKLVIEEASLLLVEMPLLTRKIHQEPVVEQIRDAERYIRAIEKEKAERKKQNPPQPASVDLRVVLLFCSPHRAYARLDKRLSGADAANTIVFDEARYLSIAARFELPDLATYIPLPIDTTDENEDRILQEAKDFFDGRPVELSEITQRLSVAQRYLNEAKEEAQRRGIVRLLV